MWHQCNKYHFGGILVLWLDHWVRSLGMQFLFYCQVRSKAISGKRQVTISSISQLSKNIIHLRRPSPKSTKLNAMGKDLPHRTELYGTGNQCDIWLYHPQEPIFTLLGGSNYFVENAQLKRKRMVICIVGKTLV